MLVSLFADGSFCPKLRVGGWGAYVVCARGRLVTGGPLKGDVVNSDHAEAMAAANALSVGVAHGLIQRGDRLLVQIDNMNVVDKLNKQKATRHLFHPINHFRFVCKSLHLTFEVRHVRGHSYKTTKAKNSYANEMCDQQAKYGLNLARQRKGSPDDPDHQADEAEDRPVQRARPGGGAGPRPHRLDQGARADPAARGARGR